MYVCRCLFHFVVLFWLLCNVCFCFFVFFVWVFCLVSETNPAA